MNNNKRLAFNSLCMLIIVLQIGYLCTFFRINYESIQSRELEIEDGRMKLAVLEQKLNILPMLQKELESAHLEKTAVKARIPERQCMEEQMAIFFDYLALHALSELKIEALEEIPLDSEVGNILEKTYAVYFCADYEEVKKLISHLESAYQMIRFKSCDISNSVQGEEKDEGYLNIDREALRDLVRVKLVFATYIQVNDVQNDAVDVAAYMFKGTNPHVFERMHPDKEERIEESTFMLEMEELPCEWQLNIGDLLTTTGAIYTLSGTGLEEALESSYEGDLHIKFYINANQYTICMVDEENQSIIKKVEYSVHTPRINVHSTMRPILEEMPNIHIYIYNESGEVVNVYLEGNLLDHIYLYDEQGKQLTKTYRSEKIECMY